jgi:hypothetical protein
MNRKKAVQQKTEPADEAAEVADEDGVDGVALTVLKVIAHNRRKGFGSSRRRHCLQPSVLRLRRLPQSCSCLLCEPRRDRRTRCLHSQGEHHHMPRSGLRLPTFKERLIARKLLLERKAAKLQPGPERDELLKKVQQVDIAENVDRWLSSPGSRPLTK